MVIGLRVDQSRFAKASAKEISKHYSFRSKKNKEGAEIYNAHFAEKYVE